MDSTSPLNPLHPKVSVWIFSLLLFIYFRRCWQGEFVQQSNASFFGDHFPHSHDLNMSFRGGITGRSLMLVTLKV